VTDTWVWTDGRVMPAERAKVAATDRALLVGQGVFETVRVNGSTPFALGRHLARLRRSAAVVRLPVPWSDDLLRQASLDTIATAHDQAGPVDGRLRITVTGGPDGGDPALLVAVTPARLPQGDAAVVVSPWPVNECSPLVGAKTTSRLDYLLAHDDARSRGADEAILLNTRGMLVEGSGSNLFLVVAGRLSTPGPATGCLPGVTRALVTELIEVARQDDLTVDDLRLAPEAFLTSTTRGVQPISSVDGEPLRSAPGPLTTAARTALDKLRAATLEP
jgi:branched-chain amino acid aminotransferase